MVYYFNYDNKKFKHMIFARHMFNEKGTSIGFRPLVERFHPEHGGKVDTISDKYDELKEACYSTEQLAMDAAYDFFSKLTK